MFFYVFSIETVLSHEITFGNIRDEMVNKLLVAFNNEKQNAAKKG